MQPTDLLVLTPEHPDYPIGVRAMARPPERLFLRGRLPQGPGLAVVGTRRATAPALQFARGLAEAAGRGGWSVWSGGALGIDTAAHEGALNAGGKTVVVMGTGFNHVYPTSNRRMFDRVLDDGGAWLSPYPPEQPGTRWTFLPRNELLASLVSDVVIVQAPARSGARSTMAAARRMGRNAWAVPTSPWDLAGAGCLAEIQAGAKVLLQASQIVGGVGARRPRWPRDLSEEERAVLEVVAMAPSNLDAICDKTGLLAGEASGAALTLTLRGELLEGADGSYHRVQR